MDDIQTNQVGQTQKCADFLAEHAADLTPTPAIAGTLLPQLLSDIDSVNDADELATQDNTGETTGKGNFRTTLEKVTYHASCGLVSYADDTDDFAMQNKFDFHFTAIQHFRDQRLLTFSKSVLKAVSVPAVATALAASHNVSAADITALTNGIADFEDVMAIPLEKRGETKGYGIIVERRIANMNGTLSKIRIKMNTYSQTNPDLFALWVAVDKTDDYGHGGGNSSTSGTVNISETKQVRVIIYDAATPIALQNTGAGELDFALFFGGIASGVAQTVAAGTTLNTTLGNIAPNADALYVINKSSTITGSYKVTI